MTGTQYEGEGEEKFEQWRGKSGIYCCFVHPDNIESAKHDIEAIIKLNDGPTPQFSVKEFEVDGRRIYGIGIENIVAIDPELITYAVGNVRYTGIYNTNTSLNEEAAVEFLKQRKKTLDDVYAQHPYRPACNALKQAINVLAAANNWNFIPSGNNENSIAFIPGKNGKNLTTPDYTCGLSLKKNGDFEISSIRSKRIYTQLRAALVHCGFSPQDDFEVEAPNSLPGVIHSNEPHTITIYGNVLLNKSELIETFLKYVEKLNEPKFKPGRSEL